MAGRIQNVEDVAFIFEGHHRGDDGNAALTLDLHPVGARLHAVLLCLDFAGKLDGAAEQQQLFRQRGLAGVRVGNDGEGAAAGNRLGQCLGHLTSNPVNWPPSTGFGGKVQLTRPWGWLDTAVIPEQ